MLSRHTQVYFSLLRLLDLALAFGAWELAYQLRFFWLNWPLAHDVPSQQEYLLAATLVSGLTGFSFSYTKAYHVQPLQRELFRVAKGIAGVIVLTLVAAFFYRDFSFSRLHFVYFVAIFATMELTSRLLAYQGMRWLHAQGYHLERILLIGSGESAAGLAEKLSRLQAAGIVLEGVITPTSGEQAPFAKHIPHLGPLESLAHIIVQRRIDQVFLALAPDEQRLLPELQSQLSKHWVDVRIVPNLGDFRTLHTEVETVEGIPIVTVVQSPLEGWNRVLKRSLDLLGALAALLIFGPLMLLVALLVCLTSPGPILYRQERMGLDGHLFYALKFRSMRVDAEQSSGAIWAKQDDDRVTPLGRWLRRLSFDELPQFFNVFWGEMSLVGPRPERPVFIDQFKTKIPGYMLRQKVKSGITGWAQINGWRGNTSLEKRIECDLYYIENWSIWLDLKILALTPFKGFIHQNAY